MSSRRMAFGTIVVLVLFTAGHPVVAVQPAPGVIFTKLWTHSHQTPGQVAEIAAFDPRPNTIWIAGIVGVDVLDAETGALVKHIDVTADGAINSVAVHNGLAALAIEAASQSATCPSCDRRNPGKVLFYDTATRLPSGPVTEVSVGSLPDMLTFTHDGSRFPTAMMWSVVATIRQNPTRGISRRIAYWAASASVSSVM